MGYADQGAAVIGPTATTSDTIVSSAVNTGGLSLAAWAGSYVWVHSDVAGSIRFVATGGAATAGDMPIIADRDYHFVVQKAFPILSIYGGGSGTVYVAKASP